MPSRKPFARIAITLPQETLAAADRRAAELDRSRSWVIAEAIQAFTARPAVADARLDTPAARGLGASRTAQLAADLRLTPEERVKAAEETARGTAARARGRVARVIGFERYEDYLDFKRRGDPEW
jgi:hypothetical protein